MALQSMLEYQHSSQGKAILSIHQTIKIMKVFSILEVSMVLRKKMLYFSWCSTNSYLLSRESNIQVVLHHQLVQSLKPTTTTHCWLFQVSPTIDKLDCLRSNRGHLRWFRVIHRWGSLEGQGQVSTYTVANTICFMGWERRDILEPYRSSALQRKSRKVICWKRKRKKCKCCFNQLLNYHLIHNLIWIFDLLIFFVEY